MKLHPLGDRILVKSLEEGERKSAGGIVIPDNAKDTPTMGIVVEVGPGRKDATATGSIPMQVKVGDSVIFGKFAGTEVEIEGKKLMIMRESDVFGIIET